MTDARALLVAVVVLSTLGTGEARGDNYRKMFLSTRADAMGGAYVSMVDDEEAIFLNPAGLAGVKGFTFNYAAVDLEVSKDLVYTGLDGAKAFSKVSPDMLNTFMGKNLFLHGQITPSLVMPKFGIALLSDHQFGLTERNQANPELGIAYQSTNGLQLAFGTSVLAGRGGRSDLRVGIATKLLWRRGGYHQLGFLDVLNFSQDPRGKLAELNGSYGRGIGVDLGTQYLFQSTKRLTLSTGLALTDIGDTTFGAAQADPQKSNLTLGVGASYRLHKAKINFAWDLQQLMNSMEFRKRSHTGVEFALPMVSVYAGLYQMALTYGASFDVWVIRVTAASYAEEQGTYATQDPERRYALRIALKIGF